MPDLDIPVEELEDLTPQELQTYTAQPVQAPKPVQPVQPTVQQPEIPIDQLEDLTPRELEGIQIQKPTAFEKAPAPKTAWDRGKALLSEAIAPIIGRTEAQQSADVQALLSADPTRVKEFFDEKGELTKRGETAWDDLMRGIDQLQGMGYGLGMLGSDLFGADRLSTWLNKRYELNKAQLEANRPAIESYKDIWKGREGGYQDIPSRMRRAMTYGRQAVFSNIPTMLPSIGAGAAGGMLAKRAISKGLEKAALQKAIQVSAEKVAAGQLLGARAGASAVEAGSIYADMKERGAGGPAHALLAAVTGIGAGWLEGITPGRMLQRAGGARVANIFERFMRGRLAKKVLDKGVTKLGLAGFESAMVEGATEYLQTAIELAAAIAVDPNEEGRRIDAWIEGMKEAGGESFVQGSIVGGAFHLAGSAVGKARSKIKNAAERKAFDIGVQSAASRATGQPVDVVFDTPEGAIQLPADPKQEAQPFVPPPIPREVPPEIQAQGEQVINQARAQGLEQTAAVLAAGQPEPAVTPILGAAATSAVGTPPIPLRPETAAPLAPPALAAEVPAAPSAVTTAPQPPSEVVPTAPPAVPAAPPAVPEALGAAVPPPAPETAPPAAPTAPPAIPQPQEVSGAIQPAPTPGRPVFAAPEAAMAASVTPVTPPVPPGKEVLPPVESIKGIVLQRNLTRDFPHLPNIEVVDTPEQFPEEAKTILRNRGTDPEDVDAFFWRDRVIFNADHFPADDPVLVKQKVVHEMAIHFGLRAAFGKERFAKLATDVWRGLNDVDRAKIVARNQLDPQNRAAIGEEWLAYEAERVATSGKTNPIWTRIAIGLRKMARRLGIPLKFSDLEIAVLVYKGFWAAEQVAGQMVQPKPGSAEAQGMMNQATKDVTRQTVEPGQLEPPEPVGQPVIAADEEAIRFSTSPTTVSNADINQVLQQYGLPELQQMLGKPDTVLLGRVQNRMINEEGWVDSILQREEKKPGLLTDEETLALDVQLLQLRTRYEQQSNAAQAAEDAGDPTQAIIHQQNASKIGQDIQRLAEVTQKAGTEWGRAGRARQMALGLDFSLQSLINKKRDAVGWRRLTDAEIRELQQTAQKYQELTQQMQKQNEELLNREVDREIGTAINQVAQDNPQVIQFAREWISSYGKRATGAKKRLQDLWSRRFPEVPLRTSQQPGVPTLPEDMMMELAIIGGSKLAMNIIERAAWDEAMVQELGEAIRPYLPQARTVAEQHFRSELAAGRAEIQARKAPRRPKKGEVRAPTLGEEMELARLKIGQTLERQRDTAEPIATAKDDLYFPVQRMMRLLIEDNPMMTRRQLVDAIHSQITSIQNELGITPEITREETMEVITGRGRVRKPDPRLAPRTMRDLKAQIRTGLKIMDVVLGRPAPETGYRPDKPSPKQVRLTKVLNWAKKRWGELATDSATQINNYLESRKTFYRNRLADLRWEIANRALKLRTQSPGATDPELDALRAEYDRTRQEHAEIFANPEYTQAQRLEAAIRAGERQIGQLEADLAAGRKTASRTPSRLQSQKLQAIRDRITQLKAEQEWAQRQIEPPPDLEKPEDLKKWFQLDREIRKIEQQIATQDVFGPGKKVSAQQPASIRAMQERLDDLKRQRIELREQLGPAKPSPEEQAILHRIALFQRQIADYSSRMANQDFGPRKRREPVDISAHPEALKWEAKRNAVVEEFYAKMLQDRLARRDTYKKVLDGIRTTRQAIVNLKSSFDFSGLRQGLLGMASMVSRMTTQPVRATRDVTRVFGQMFQAAWSKQKAREIMLAYQKRPNAKSGADRIGGIDLSDIESPKFTKWEENARSIFDEWAETTYRQPTVRRTIAMFPRTFLSRSIAGSNRAFAVFLNGVRTSLYDQLLDLNFKDRAPTENEMRILGNWVNVATGRGSISPRYASAAAQVIWAPKLLASRLQFLIGQPLWGGGALKDSAKARKIIATEYARVMGTGFLLAMIASLFDEKKERSPVSSDFGKIVRGNTRIDIWGGLQQMVVLLSRMASGKVKTLRGTTYDMGAQRKYGQPDKFITLARFGRSKLRPDVGAALDVLTGTTYQGKPLTIEELGEDLLIPLPFADIEKILKDRGFTEGMILEVMNQFGAGVNTYEPRRGYSRQTRTQ